MLEFLLLWLNQFHSVTSSSSNTSVITSVAHRCSYSVSKALFKKHTVWSSRAKTFGRRHPGSDQAAQTTRRVGKKLYRPSAQSKGSQLRGIIAILHHPFILLTAVEGKDASSFFLTSISFISSSSWITHNATESEHWAVRFFFLFCFTPSSSEQHWVHDTNTNRIFHQPRASTSSLVPVWRH